jgi:hypothetical protein
MLQSTFKQGRAIVAGTLAAGITFAGIVACEPSGGSHFSGLTAAQPERVSANGSQTFDCSTGAACVTGDSSGTKTSGVIGAAAGQPGVYGFSLTGAGVHGTSMANGGSGVRGVSSQSGQWGVYGLTEDQTGEYAGVWAEAVNTKTWIFEGFDSATGAGCGINPNADLSCSGSINVKSEHLKHVTSGGRPVLTYASESTAQALDEVGSARLVAGVANVALDAAFASAIDPNDSFQVVLTPMGETRGLYVSRKMTAGFQVREAQGGRSTLSFDYRVVARPFDGERGRLATTGDTSMSAARHLYVPTARDVSNRNTTLAVKAPAPLSTQNDDCSGDVACVYGDSSGANTSGVSGISSATSGFAYGVKGTSGRSNGVEGISTSSGDAGVTGKQLNTSSNSGIGVFAESKGPGSIALVAASDGTNASLETFSFLGENVATGGDCYIDQNADFVCNGGMEARSLRVRHLSRDGRAVSAYASESASPSLSDVGTARLIAGVANVRVDPAFASLIDRRSYHVFVTPLGDTRGLYVSLKRPSSFQVREAERGNDSLDFDYRIVGRPLDVHNDRLPLAPRLRKPREPVQP